MMTAAGVIDDKTFDELLTSTGGDAAFVAELLDTYLQDAPELLTQMHSALGAGDADAFRRAAHSLKSNSATFGALALSGQARELEMMGKEGSLGGAAVRIAAAEAEFVRVRAALEQKRAALK